MVGERFGEGNGGVALLGNMARQDEVESLRIVINTCTGNGCMGAISIDVPVVVTLWRIVQIPSIWRKTSEPTTSPDSSPYYISLHVMMYILLNVIILLHSLTQQ